MLFSQFPAPATALGPENSSSTHSRPGRLRRLSNLRNNYRAAVNSAGGHARSGSSTSTSTSSNNTPAGPSSDLHLTRSLTTSNSQPANISHSASSSSTTSSASSSQGAQQQQQLQSQGSTSEQGHGSRLTQVQSSPSTPSIPSSGAAATTSEGAQTGFATTTNTNTTRSTNDGHLAPNPTASQIRTGDATSVSSRSPSASALSVAESTASETHPSPPDAVPTSHPATSSGEAAAETPTAATMTRPRSSTTGNALAGEAATAPFTAAQFLPSIRLSAYYDPRSARPSLSFPPISRTLPSGTETIRVGRYSERDSHSMANMPGNTPSAAPVGFKSKVVSRRHCEFWYENGKWYIKDVKSSSGTFLNHIRLSPPSQESKAFPVNDGDIVQLGIDFKGGEEMIFRCVKMRLELNRGWQNKLNTFNVAAHKRLRTMGTDSQSTSGSSDCSICLNSIAPCQSLFVAPCSHTWHYKCVRSLLNSPQYPIFVCPNCRAGADLEADVEDPAENWEQTDVPEPSGDDVSVHAPNGHDGLSNGDSSAAGQDMTIMPAETPDVNDGPEVDPMELTVNIPPAEAPEARGNLPHAVSEPLPIRNVAPGAGRASDNAAGTPPGPNAEGPITPRNDAGPWVFDGRAGQAEAESPSNGMRSLDAAADDLHNGVQTSSESSSR